MVIMAVVVGERPTVPTLRTARRRFPRVHVYAYCVRGCCKRVGFVKGCCYIKGHDTLKH